MSINSKCLLFVKECNDYMMLNIDITFLQVL